MRYFWVVIFLSFISICSAQNEVKTASFFFKPKESNLTVPSAHDLDTFLHYLKVNSIVITEINGYSSKEGKVDVNQLISKLRIETVKSKIDTSIQIKKVNNYGVNYPKELPYPVNSFDKWRRVDIKYTVSQKIETKLPDTIIRIKPEIDPKFFEETKKLSVKEELESKVLEPGMVFSVELNIQFYDGTHNLTPNSYPEIQELADYLLAHPNVKAFVRGHVCCGKAMKLSKKRAQVVCIELINKGVKKKRLKHQGFSNKLPLVSPERTEEDRRRNRRVDVIFSVE